MPSNFNTEQPDVFEYNKSKFQASQCLSGLLISLITMKQFYRIFSTKFKTSRWILSSFTSIPINIKIYLKWLISKELYNLKLLYKERCFVLFNFVFTILESHLTLSKHNAFSLSYVMKWLPSTTTDPNTELCDQQQKVNYMNFCCRSKRWSDIRLKDF